MLLKSLWQRGKQQSGKKGFRLRELLLFYLNCSPTVQEYLKTGGIVDASHYIHNSDRTEGGSS